jgi:hypothetical protein
VFPECGHVRDVRPQLSCAVRRVVGEEVAPGGLIEEVIGNHAAPGVGERRVAGKQSVRSVFWYIHIQGHHRCRSEFDVNFRCIKATSIIGQGMAGKSRDEESNIHARIRLGEHTPKDTAKECLIFMVEEVDTIRGGKVEIEKPAREVLAVSIHDVLDRGPVVHE